MVLSPAALAAAAQGANQQQWSARRHVVSWPFCIAMPIYEYQCPKCQHTFEEWVKASESHGQEPCPKCGEPSSRIMSQTSFVLKGGGWYVSDYGYRKGVNEEGASSAGSSATSDGSAASSGSQAAEKAPAATPNSGTSAAKAAPAPSPTTGAAASAPTKAASAAS